jgi:hypothetical protein
VSEILRIYDPGHPRWRIRANADLVILSTEASQDVLASTVGLEPDKKWAKDTTFGPGGRGRHPYTGVSYKSRLDEKDDPSDHVAELVDRLRPYVAGIAAVNVRPTTYGICFWVAEHTRAHDRQIDVEPEDLAMIGAMGARLSLDLYVYVDDEEE